MNKNIYTYENWLSGNICPAPSLIKNGNKNNDHSFSWTNFSKPVLKKIRNKQKDIFYQEVNKISNHLIKEFNKIYKTSKEKTYYLAIERKKIEEILFETVPSNHEFSTTRRSNIVFNSNELREIQNYIERIHIKNMKQEFEFIHSSMCQFHDKEIIHPAIKAEAYYSLLNHIRAKFTNDKGLRYNGIFEEEYGIELCTKLVNKIVKENSKVSDYSFIYYKLVEVKIINAGNVNHGLFIKFINEIFPIKLNKNLKQLRILSSSKTKERDFLEIYKIYV